MSVSSGGSPISRTEMVAERAKAALGTAVVGAEGEAASLDSRSSSQNEAVWSATLLGKVAMSHLSGG